MVLGLQFRRAFDFPSKNGEYLVQFSINSFLAVTSYLITSYVPSLFTIN
jgi:hypothetical protein